MGVCVSVYDRQVGSVLTEVRRLKPRFSVVRL